jgi:hypothetical protein
MSLTAAAGTPDPLVSWTEPVTAPANVCAAAGTRAATANMAAIESILFDMETSFGALMDSRLYQDRGEKQVRKQWGSHSWL